MSPIFGSSRVTRKVLVSLGIQVRFESESDIGDSCFVTNMSEAGRVFRSFDWHFCFKRHPTEPKNSLAYIHILKAKKIVAGM